MDLARPFACVSLGALLNLATLATGQDPAREPKPIFEMATNAAPAFDAAKRRAARDNRRVLVVFGGDWSVWCQRFHELTGKDRAIAKLLREDFETVLVAVGPDEIPDGNRALAERLGANPITDDVPYLVVTTPDGEVIVKRPTQDFQVAESYSAKAVGEFLRAHVPPPLDAREVLDRARAQAAHDGRRLLIHIGAPWCGWCHRLEEFLALPEIEPLIAKDLIDVKIDQDRMTHGKEVTHELRGNRSGGIPWIVITDADLAEIITSDAPEGNIGYPVKEHEIGWFMAMLEKVRENMTAEDLVTIRGILETRSAEILRPAERAAENAEDKAAEGQGDHR
jgi:thioredoxin-related protein